MPVPGEPGTRGAPAKVVVLDFDGTLIDSNGLKRAAYYQLFDGDRETSALIDRILETRFEESRYLILRLIRDALQRGPAVDAHGETLEALAARYDKLAREGAKACPEIPGADGLLQALHRRYRLYLSSTTPIESLREVVACRGWSGYFQGIYGYPAEKTASLREIISREHVPADDVVVFGDGESDRSSARAAGCRFFPAGDAGRIESLRAALQC